MTPLLELSFATTQLGQQYFGPFNVRVAPGERIAILGPSGAGKSTLLKLMARELHPQAGQVMLAGRPLAQWPLADLALRRAVLPQGSNVAFGLQCERSVGFIGLIAPHLVRTWLGADQRKVLPLAMLAGGLLLLLADTLARTVAIPAEVPVGIFTALLGGPFFLMLLRRFRHGTA